MASYAFTGNAGVIGTSKPHILLAARSGNPGAIGSSTPKPHSKPHMLAARAGAIGSSTLKPHILLGARAEAIGNSTPKPHILLAACAGNPGATDSSTPELQPFEFQEEDIASEAKLWDLYERWRSHYNISCTPEEIYNRFNVFKQNAMFVHNTNTLNLSFKVGLNHFGDMTNDELNSFLLNRELIKKHKHWSRT